MYTVLIVDDEPLVRRGVAQMIDWQALGLTTVLQAEDGSEALDICRKQKVDLVLTDIVMPFMDGLELSEALGQEYPDTQVVILTGHEDFEYAKQSVDLGVRNYILKPVGANTLYEKMQEICYKMQSEDKQKQYVARMKHQLHQSMPVWQEKFLQVLVCTENNIGIDIEKRIENLELPLQGDSFIVAVAELDMASVKSSDTELYMFTAKNIVQECVGKEHCIFDEDGKIVIVFNLSCIEEEGHDIVYQTMQVIQKTIYATIRINNTCALGTSVEELTELHTSWRDAGTALDCKYSLGINRVYDIKDLDYVERCFYYPFEEIKNLISSIKLTSENEIEAAVQSVNGALSGMQNMSSANVRMVFVEIVTMLLKELAGLKEVPAEVWNEGFALYNALGQIISIDQMCSCLLDFAKKVASQLHKLQKNSGEIIVHKTRTYIEENYQDENLTLSAMAEVVGVSMGYLSALFKKATGRNFTECLTQVRIRHAKELLRTTDKKTYEIAYETGYANPHYFSISFKKSTGLSPSEFRSSR